MSQGLMFVTEGNGMITFQVIKSVWSGKQHPRCWR